MKIGDLVKIKQKYMMHKGSTGQHDLANVGYDTHIIVDIYGSNKKLVCLTGYPVDVAFQPEYLEVINESN